MTLLFLLWVVVQSLSHVQLFWTPKVVACQASVSSTVSWSLLKFMSTESMMLSNHLFLCCPLLLPSIFNALNWASGSFPMSWFFISGGQSTEVSASASVLPKTIQSWFPSGLTGLISLQSKGLSIAFSSTTVWKHQLYGTQPSLWSSSHICKWLLEKQ